MLSSSLNYGQNDVSEQRRPPKQSAEKRLALPHIECQKPFPEVGPPLSIYKTSTVESWRAP